MIAGTSASFQALPLGRGHSDRAILALGVDPSRSPFGRACGRTANLLTVAQTNRYFPATILGGRLHVRGIPDWGPWNPARLEWDDEGFVNILLSTRQADRKVRTREELEAIMKEPKRAPSREVWMHESLVNEARRLWEQMVADL